VNAGLTDETITPVAAVVALRNGASFVPHIVVAGS
jgi:hypothetical protein